MNRPSGDSPGKYPSLPLIFLTLAIVTYLSFVFEIRWLLYGLHGGATLQAAVVAILDHSWFLTPPDHVDLPVMLATWVLDAYNLDH